MKTVENFVLIKPIGQGQYGKVFLTKIKDQKAKMNTMRPIRKGRVAACKVIPTSISAKN
jgi:hypothetical protein